VNLTTAFAAELHRLNLNEKKRKKIDHELTQICTVVDRAHRDFANHLKHLGKEPRSCMCMFEISIDLYKVRQEMNLMTHNPDEEDEEDEEDDAFKVEYGDLDDDDLDAFEYQEYCADFDDDVDAADDGW